MNRVILLVEDDESDEALTLRAFERAAIVSEIVVQRDGAAALDWLFGAGDHASRLPVLILLDLNLPKVSGFDVLRRIRADERTKLVPVVVFSSSSEEEDVRRSYELRANAYVRKPVDFTEFAATAKTLGQFWIHSNQPSPARPSSAVPERP